MGLDFVLCTKYSAAPLKQERRGGHMMQASESWPRPPHQCSAVGQSSSRVSWPTLASREASLLGLDSVDAESDCIADSRRLQQKEPPSSRISARLAAFRVWYVSLRERQSDSGKMQLFLAEHG